MRVALVYPFLKGGRFGCGPPLALLYLAAALKESNTEVKVFDRDRYRDNASDLIKDIVDYAPKIVGLPVFTLLSSFKEVRTICRELRERMPKATILGGGPHASALPEQTLDWFPQMDFVLQGEADYTFPELVKQIKDNVAEPRVPGLFYRENGSVGYVPKGEPPKDLDAIPFPDRKNVLDNYRDGLYWRLDRSGPVDLVITSRGCPFHCKFCYKTEEKFRFRSPENVVKEIEQIASLGITSIDIEDDLFTVPKKRCVAICRMIRDAGLKIDFKVRSRVDTIDEEVLNELRKAGVRNVVYGFESGSQKILKAMGKKTTVERNYEVVRMTKKAGLRCHADILIGYPGEDSATIGETARFLSKARPTSMLMSVMTPFPRTPLYEEAKTAGTLIGDWGIDKKPPYVKLPWMDDYESLWKESRRVYRKYYSHPAVLYSMARHMPMNRQLMGAGVKFLWNVMKV